MANRIRLSGTTNPTFQVGLRGVTLSSEAVTQPYTLVLPPALGTDGQALLIDSTGNFIFGDVASDIAEVPYISWVATDGQTVFTDANLALYTSETQLTVFRNGVLMMPQEYTLSDDTLTVSTVVSAGDDLEIPSRGVVGGATQGPQGIQGPQGPAGGSSSYFNYRAHTTTTSGTPGTGHVLWNNATQTSATSLNFSHFDRAGDDIQIFLHLLKAGDTLILQDANASANYQIFTVTSDHTEGDAWDSIPVSFVESGGTGTTGFANNHPLIVVTKVGAGSGGGSSGTDWANTAAIAVGDIFAGQTLSAVTPGSTFTPTSTKTVLPIQVDNPSLNTGMLACAYDPVSKIMIAVGNTVGTPSLGIIMRSTDGGKTWTRVVAPSGATQSYYGIAFADTPAGRTFLACGLNTGQYMYSRDGGLNWTVGTTGATTGQYTVTYSPTLDTWLIGGQNGWVSTSTDLTNWGRRQITGAEFKNFRAISWIPSISKFFAPYTVNNYFSDDGVTWTSSGINFNDKSVYGIATYGNTTVICGAQALLGWTTDFVTWTYNSTAGFPTLPLLTGVAYNETSGMFYATGQSGWSAFSTNATTWTPVNIMSNTVTMNAVMPGDDGFVSVGNSGLISRCNIVENSVYTAEMVKVPSGTYKCLGQTSGYGGVYSRMYGALWKRTA